MVYKHFLHENFAEILKNKEQHVPLDFSDGSLKKCEPEKTL